MSYASKTIMSNTINDNFAYLLIKNHAKEIAVENDCGSLDQPGSAIANDCDFLFLFFCFAIASLEHLGRVVYRWKCILKTSPMICYKPPSS